MLDPETAQLWGPGGKQLLPEKKLGDFVGRNEKTKVVLKLTKKGAGAPQREAPISAEEHKNMLSYYYKKQEEAKKLAEAQEDVASSAWADPRSLKSAFTGIADIKLGGRGGTGFNQGVL